MDAVLLLSASELARRVRTRELGSRAIVEAHIAHATKVNPSLNAIVADRFAQARAEADAADVRVREGTDDLPPFHGVPCTIKECFALEGMPWTAGLLSRKGTLADRDAPAVARMRAAGFIPLGVTNTSELCMWMESTNRVYGRTSSAYDPRRTAGGSSGGEGAIVGAGASPVGLGSDIGGSIRMPAFFNGVFGHKPSGGLVPGAGQFPVATGRARRMLSTGPLTRHARDLMPVLRLLAGAHDVDDCEEIALRDPDAVDLREVTVWDVRDDASVGRVERALLDAQESAVTALSRRGARVKRASLPGMREAFFLWSAAMHAWNETSFASLMRPESPLGAWEALREIPRALRGRSPWTVPALGLVVGEVLPDKLPKLTARSLDAIERLRGEVDGLLSDGGVLLAPSHTRVAPLHHTPLATFFDAGLTGVFNVLFLPVTQVPLGLDRRGLPTGVQVVGAHGEDHRTIAVAQALEDALGGWVPPPRWA